MEPTQQCGAGIFDFDRMPSAKGIESLNHCLGLQIRIIAFVGVGMWGGNLQETNIAMEHDSFKYGISQCVTRFIAKTLHDFVCQEEF